MKPIKFQKSDRSSILFGLLIILVVFFTIQNTWSINKLNSQSIEINSLKDQNMQLSLKVNGLESELGLMWYAYDYSNDTDRLVRDDIEEISGFVDMMWFVYDYDERLPYSVREALFEMRDEHNEMMLTYDEAFRMYENRLSDVEIIYSGGHLDTSSKANPLEGE